MPCGVIADTFFNDTFQLFFVPQKSYYANVTVKYS
jgi:hypothetical protein